MLPQCKEAQSRQRRMLSPASLRQVHIILNCSSAKQSNCNREHARLIATVHLSGITVRRSAYRFLAAVSLLDGLFHTLIDVCENFVLLGFGQGVEGLVWIVGRLKPGQLRIIPCARADRDPKNQTAAVLSFL